MSKKRVYNQENLEFSKTKNRIPKMSILQDHSPKYRNLGFQNFLKAISGFSD